MLSRKAQAERREYFLKKCSKPVSDSNYRVRGYIRISGKSIGQDERRQISGYIDFAKAHPKFSEVTQYIEKASGKGGYVRKKFNDMMNDAKANKFDLLWVEQPSRLGRNVREGLNYVHELNELGIMVYIEKFGKVFDPSNDMDKIMLAFAFIVAEGEHDWNSKNTKKSMEVKGEMLESWATENGLFNIRPNNAKFCDMYIKDKFWRKEKKAKKGICVVEIPHMKDLWIQNHMCGLNWKEMAKKFRSPVNHKCEHGCWNGKEFPFGSMPRLHGKHGGPKKLYRSEVAKFLNDGGWASFIKPDNEISKEAFIRNNGKKVPKRKCGCGQIMSSVTISNINKELCYDSGIEKKRKPEAFVRKDAISTEVDIEELEAILLSGKVSSR